jgi:hypothetical protein
MAIPPARPWIECQNPFRSWLPSNHRMDRRRIAKTAKNTRMASRRWFCCAMVMKHAPFEMLFGVEAVIVNEVEVPPPRSCLLYYHAFFFLLKESPIVGPTLPHLLLKTRKKHGAIPGAALVGQIVYPLVDTIFSGVMANTVMGF